MFLVEEADIEDKQGNITKELYVLQVAPLESHTRYRQIQDPAVFSDGGLMILTARSVVWPHIPIPVLRKRSAPSTSAGTTNVTTKASCGSTHTQLKKDLLLQNHNLVKLYHMHSAPAVLSHV